MIPRVTEHRSKLCRNVSSSKTLIDRFRDYIRTKCSVGISHSSLDEIDAKVDECILSYLPFITFCEREYFSNFPPEAEIGSCCCCCCCCCALWLNRVGLAESRWRRFRMGRLPLEPRLPPFSAEREEGFAQEGEELVTGSDPTREWGQAGWNRADSIFCRFNTVRNCFCLGRYPLLD